MRLILRDTGSVAVVTNRFIGPKRLQCLIRAAAFFFARLLAIADGDDAQDAEQLAIPLNPVTEFRDHIGSAQWRLCRIRIGGMVDGDNFGERVPGECLIWGKRDHVSRAYAGSAITSNTTYSGLGFGCLRAFQCGRGIKVVPAASTLTPRTNED